MQYQQITSIRSVRVVTDLTPPPSPPPVYIPVPYYPVQNTERRGLLNAIEDDKSWRKVYATLGIQLLFSVGIFLLAGFYNGLNELICEHYAITTFVFIFVCCTIACMCDHDHIDEAKVPLSVFILLPFTIGNIWNLEPCTNRMFSLNTFMLSIGLTIFVAIILTIVAFKIKWDSTNKAEPLTWSYIFLIVSLTIYWFTKEDLVVRYFMYTLCVFMFSVYLIFFTQHLKNNNYNRPVEYIIVGSSLYLSILNIFMYILRICGTAGWP